LALFKIFNNFNDLTKTIDNVSNHKAGYCYFDATTNKFYVDTIDDSAGGLRQLNGTFYGECSTDGSLEIKTTNISGFALAKGVAVYIRFINTNTAVPSLLKLNISNTGDIAIKKYGTAALDSNTKIMAGSVINLVYDGTNWIWVGYSTIVSSGEGGTGTTTGRLIFGNGTYVFDGSEDVTVPLYTGSGTWSGDTSENTDENGNVTDENGDILSDENGNGLEFDGYDDENTSTTGNVNDENGEIISDETGDGLDFDGYDDENDSGNINSENEEMIFGENGEGIVFDGYDDDDESATDVIGFDGDNSNETNTPLSGENNE